MLPGEALEAAVACQPVQPHGHRRLRRSFHRRTGHPLAPSQRGDRQIEGGPSVSSHPAGPAKIGFPRKASAEGKGGVTLRFVAFGYASTYRRPGFSPPSPPPWISAARSSKPGRPIKA